MRIFTKLGHPSYKEKKLIGKIQPVIDKLESEGKLVDFQPTDNLDGLQKIYDKYCSSITDVGYTEIIHDKNKTASLQDDVKKEIIGGATETKDAGYEGSTSDDNSTLIDPFNRHEPIINDYVQSDNLNKAQDGRPTRTIFDEPKTSKEAFEIPNPAAQVNKDTNTNNVNLGQSPKEQKQPLGQGKQDILNPSNNEDVSAAKKRKNTKRASEYIVKLVCKLAEAGFIWYATNDINDAKLIEYEATGEIDVRILVTLDDNQRGTIKQFFVRKCSEAEYLAKFTEQEKTDLANALTEYLLEKKVELTPLQDLILIGGEIFGAKGLDLAKFKIGINSVLVQLREMSVNNVKHVQIREAPPVQQPETVTETAPEVETPEVVETETVVQADEAETQDYNQKEGNFENLPAIINEPIATKE